MKKLIILLFCINLLNHVFAQTNAIKTVPFSIKGFKLAIKDFIIDNNNDWWLSFGEFKSGSATHVSTIGLAWYHNNTWRNWNVENSPLPTNVLTGLAENGLELWIGSHAGLIKKAGDNWTIYNKANSGLTTDTINDVAVYNNIVWAATNHGLFRFDGTNWTRYTKQQNQIIDDKINIVLADKNNNVWIATHKGISRITNNVVTNFDSTNTQLNLNDIAALNQNENGEVFVSTQTPNYSPDYRYTLYVFKQNDFIPWYNQSEGKCNIKAINTSRTNSQIVFHNYNPLAFIEGYFSNLIESQAKPLLSLGRNGITSYYPITVKMSYYGRFFYSKNNMLYIFRDDSIKIIKLDSLPQKKLMLEKEGIAYLDINKVSTPILTRGDMFWDLYDAGYEVPKGHCKTSIFCSGLWMGGVANNELRIAAQTYRQSGNDYYEGPLKIGTASTILDTLLMPNKIWRVNRQSIEAFKTNFANGNVSNGTYPIPEVMLTWPAHGDSLKGYAPNLAPFVDVNNDGKYNPYQGDYPKIRGDQMLYWIFNDNTYNHSESQGKPLGVEIHGSAYAFTCENIADTDSNTALNYTTLYHFDVYNRNNYDIDSMVYGIFLDSDIGLPSDDYVGCNPKKGYAFAYNGDDYDGLSTPSYVDPGYGYNPPAIGVKLLNNNADIKMTGFVYYNNDWTGKGNPSRPEHYWNYLNNRWRDNTPITYGGNGYGGNDTASFMFPGNNDLAARANWSEASVQNTPGDRRFLMNIKPNGKLQGGKKQSFDYAIVFSRAASGGALASLQKLDSDIDKVQNWYNNQNFPSCLDLTVGLNKLITPETKNDFIVYPNPANDYIEIKTDNNSKIQGYEIIDITGRMISNGAFNGPIHIQHLNKGVYVIKVQVNGSTVCKKFIKH